MRAHWWLVAGLDDLLEFELVLLSAPLLVFDLTMDSVA